MKQCPVCKTTYTDVSLAYCLADGNALTDLGGQNAGIHDEETIVAGRPGGQMRVDIPQRSVSPQQAAGQAPPPARSSHLFLKILLGLLAVGFLAAVAVVVGAIVYLNSSRETDTAANLKSTTPKPTASAKPAANETDELRDQIAELEKLINEQKKSDKPVNVPLLRELTSTRTARASIRPAMVFWPCGSCHIARSVRGSRKFLTEQRSRSVRAARLSGP